MSTRPTTRRPDKGTLQRLHARRRAYERYDLKLNRHTRRQLVQLIQKGEGDFVEKQSHRVSVWDLTYEGKRIRVCYDKLRQNIITFLPLTNEPPSQVRPKALVEKFDPPL